MIRFSSTIRPFFFLSVIEVNVIKADRQTGAWENIVTTESLRLLVNVWGSVNTAMHVIHTLGQILTNIKLPHTLIEPKRKLLLFPFWLHTDVNFNPHMLIDTSWEGFHIIYHIYSKNMVRVFHYFIIIHQKELAWIWAFISAIQSLGPLMTWNSY